MISPNKFHEAIENAKNTKGPPKEFTYNDRDVILYNMSLGAQSKQIHLVFEQHPSFQVLPTYGVIMSYTAPRSFDMAEIIPNFSYKMLLHGEQFLEIRKWPIPTSLTVVSEQKLVDVIDKGSAAVVITGATSCDARTGEELFYSETTLFIRGSGSFNGPSNSTRLGGKATAAYTIPDQVPDAVREEKTSPDQSALYRLNGDRNSLHIDPMVAAAAGFEEGPILHGLCTFGITAKHILETYAEFQNIKVRFAGIVIPGQTLRTEMWRDGQMVLFQTRVKETGKLCIRGGGAELFGKGSKL